MNEIDTLQKMRFKGYLNEKGLDRLIALLSGEEVDNEPRIADGLRKGV